MLNLKGLPARFSSPQDERQSTSLRFAGPQEVGVAYLLIPKGLMASLRRRIGEALLNLKDLLTVLPSCGRETFSGLVGRRSGGDADLLIPQGLMAHLLRRTREGLLNLKDLLTMFRPRLRRLFENEPVDKASFSCKIAPIFAIFRQKRADNGRKWLSFGTESGLGARASRPLLSSYAAPDPRPLRRELRKSGRPARAPRRTTTARRPAPIKLR